MMNNLINFEIFWDNKALFDQIVALNQPMGKQIFPVKTK